MNNNNLTIYGLNDSIAYCEAKGLSKCFEAYADLCSRYTIESIGFNANSGYTYISLECGITIASMLGRGVDYLVYDLETGEEYIYDTFEEAEKHEIKEDEE
jgi:hypothetical protein